MSKHTSAPWKVQNTDGAIVGKINDLPECLGVVFRIVRDSRFVGEWTETTEANARLIEAAPELFLLAEHISQNPYALTPDQWQSEANGIFKRYKLSGYFNSERLQAVAKAKNSELEA